MPITSASNPLRNPYDSKACALKLCKKGLHILLKQRREVGKKERKGRVGEYIKDEEGKKEMRMKGQARE